MSFELSLAGKDAKEARIDGNELPELKLSLADLRADFDKSPLFQTVAHDRLNKRPQWPAPPETEGLTLRKTEPCLLSSSQKINQALTDNWAIYPGATGLIFGAASGSITKHLALSPAMEAGARQFRVARAGFIWGLAGFAANYVGGAVASYLSAGDREELCQRNNDLSKLSAEMMKQRQYIQELSGHIQQLLEKGQR